MAPKSSASRTIQAMDPEVDEGVEVSGSVGESVGESVGAALAVGAGAVATSRSGWGAA